MNGKIQVLNIGIDDCTAKEAMKQTVAYMETEPVNVIELVTVDTLMYASGDPALRENIEKSDLVLAGEKEILESADQGGRHRIQEIEQRRKQVLSDAEAQALDESHEYLHGQLDRNKSVGGVQPFREPAGVRNVGDIFRGLFWPLCRASLPPGALPQSLGTRAYPPGRMLSSAGGGHSLCAGLPSGGRSPSRAVCLFFSHSLCGGPGLLSSLCKPAEPASV